MDFTVLGNGWPVSMWIVSFSMGLLTDGKYGSEVGAHLLCCTRLDAKGAKPERAPCAECAMGTGLEYYQHCNCQGCYRG